MSAEIWAREVKRSVVHGLAIIVTLFRLLYRWYMLIFWWEDAWAALALVFDIGCLVSVWMEVPAQNRLSLPRIDIMANWILSVTITCIIWCARMSILCSIVRIANPSPNLRRIAYCIAAVFLTTGFALVAQKIVVCSLNSCKFTMHIAITQLVTDVFSDAMLVAASVRFLRDVKLSRKRRVLILSTFSASVLITAVTILHSVLLLLQEPTTGTIVIGHVKAGLSLLVCNALVLVTFVYRVCRHADVDVDQSVNGRRPAAGLSVQFTSVVEIPTKLSLP
ncbi:hypothetical protein BDN67DRAFT_971363 [Paxillus ammoniavirescens]|nr:hypothetical protein BDN67DRAFT_971363 [Paxillus ammoniavirescens]